MSKNNKIQTSQARLFKPEHKDFDLPEFEFSQLIEAYDQMELLGFPLCSHFDLLKEPPENKLTAKKLKDLIGKNVKIYGNMVDNRKNSTSNGKYMFFATLYDVEGGIFDVVLFPPVAKYYDFLSFGIHLCYGKVTEDLGHICIDIKKMVHQEIHSDPRLVGSDFKVKMKH